jgi:hypothetical protein
MQRLIATALVIALASVTPASAKTAKECNAEYAANKAAIQGTQKKADFIAACRAGTETVPDAGSTSIVPTPAQAATPAPAPAVPAGQSQAQRPIARITRTAPPTTATAAGASQFPAEAQAQARCPGATVVWVNTKSGVYHFAGTKNYGNTKAGAYMCEADATAAGDRASKTEKHP